MTTRLAGLLVRRDRWSLGWRGWLLGLGLLLVTGVAGHWFVHPFLAISQPLRGEILVVEGWIPVYTLHQAATQFTHGNYQQLVIVRALYEGEPGVQHGRHSAEYAATVLQRCGVPSNSIATVLFSGGYQDRTYHSALEVKRWLVARNRAVAAVDVVTVGPHARRSRLLYQRAFGSLAKIGVISLPDPAYDPRRWWRSSEGVRVVVGESLAYFYARFLFWA